MASLMTLAQWAQARGLNPNSVRNHWVPRDGFPAPKHRPAYTGVVGAPSEEYDPAELDAWRAEWDATHRPDQHEMPPDPQEYRTLGAIAKILGVDGKSVRQYRPLLDEHAAFEDRGRRRFYRTADVVDLLNSRRGPGQARTPDRDRRRRAVPPVAVDE